MIWICIAALACIWIAVEDIHSREISIWPILLIAISGAFQGYDSWMFAFNSIFNLGLLLCILLSLKGFYWLKGEYTLMDEKLGWGDVCLLVAFALWLSPEWFLYFFIITNVIALTFTLIVKWVHEVETVPLGAYLGLVFVGLHVLNLFSLIHL